MPFATLPQDVATLAHIQDFFFAAILLLFLLAWKAAPCFEGLLQDPYGEDVASVFAASQAQIPEQKPTAGDTGARGQSTAFAFSGPIDIHSQAPIAEKSILESALEAQLQRCEMEKARLSRQLAEAEGNVGALRAQMDRLSGWETELKSQQSDFEKSLDARKRSMELLEQASLASIRERERSVRESEQEMTEFHAELLTLRKDLREARSSIGLRDVEIDSLNGDCSKLEGHLTRLQQETSQQKSTLARLSKSNEEAEKTIPVLTEQKFSAEQGRILATKRATSLAEELQAGIEHDRQIRRLKKEKAKLESEKAGLEKQLARKKAAEAYAEGLNERPAGHRLVVKRLMAKNARLQRALSEKSAEVNALESWRPSVSSTAPAAAESSTMAGDSQPKVADDKEPERPSAPSPPPPPPSSPPPAPQVPRGSGPAIPEQRPSDEDGRPAAISDKRPGDEDGAQGPSAGASKPPVGIARPKPKPSIFMPQKGKAPRRGGGVKK
ncbi:hypothetical protein KC338_g4518 [Hortaea werneckii]|nr:hypothetical protein KC338_g4518 [Hortaea werneckii]